MPLPLQTSLEQRMTHTHTHIYIYTHYIISYPRFAVPRIVMMHAASNLHICLRKHQGFVTGICRYNKYKNSKPKLYIQDTRLERSFIECAMPRAVDWAVPQIFRGAAHCFPLADWSLQSKLGGKTSDSALNNLREGLLRKWTCTVNKAKPKMRIQTNM